MALRFSPNSCGPAAAALGPCAARALVGLTASAALTASPPGVSASGAAVPPAEVRPEVVGSVAPLTSPDPRLEEALRGVLYPVRVTDAQGHGPDPGSAEWRQARQRLIGHACEAGRTPAHDTRYAYNRVDLNGDGRPEVVVSLVGPLDCGTGGCPLLIFRDRGGSLELVSQMTLFRDPLIVAESRHHGWRDLSSRVRLDAGHGYEALLRFDGRRYPSNPSVAPAQRLTRPLRGTAYLAWSEDPATRHPLPCRAPQQP